MAVRSATNASRNDDFGKALFDPDIEVPPGLTGPDGIASPRRFAVYRNNVVVSLLEAMRSAYPSVLAILGSGQFDRIARNYIAQHPPRSAMMQAYGQEFADFLASFPPLGKSLFLADVARIERAWLDAYHAADVPCLTGETLRELAPEVLLESRFKLHPAAFLLASRHPVLDLFAWRNGRPEEGVDLSLCQNAAVTRPGLAVMVTELDEAGFMFCSSLAAGDPLGEAAGAALGLREDFDLAAGLANIFAIGLLCEP